MTLTTRKRKIRSTAIFLLLFLLAFTGCGEGKETGGEQEEDNHSVVIRFAWWGDEERAKRTKDAVALFMERNPEVRVQTVYFPFDTYSENLEIAARAGYMPDVWQGYIGSATDNSFLEAGLIEPLDGYVEEGLIDTADISENLLDSGRIDGNLYGLSLGCNVKCMAVDPEIFEEAGLEIPEVCYGSWEELERDLLHLKEKGFSCGGGELLERGFLFEYFCRQRGEQMYAAPDQLAIGFSRETYVDFYQMRMRWEKEGLTVPYRHTGNQHTADTGKKTEKYAVYLLYSNQYELLMQDRGQKLELLLMPGANVDQVTDIRPGNHICMSAVSEQKELSARLIDFLINDVDANKILNAERGMPASRKVREVLMTDFKEEQKTMAEIVTLAEEYSSPGRPVMKVDTSALDGGSSGGMMEDMEQKIMYGLLTPEEAYTLLEKSYGPQ